MPEYGECHAHLLTGRFFLKTLGKAPKTKLKGIHLDWATKDTSSHPDHLHVFEAGPESRFVRGPKSAQTRVVPDELIRSPSNPNPKHISELDYVWEDVYGNGRAIFLVFSGGRVFEFHWLTHSSIQLYTRQVWEESVMRVDREIRGFRVAIAFEFEDYFLSFNSIDLVVKPVWRVLSAADLVLPIPSRLKLGVDVYRDFGGFLEAVATWILHRRRGSSKRVGLACEAVRSASLVWVGVGVYTVCEIFFLAGCSPFLVEFELFDCPSRTARLCEAFWIYAHSRQNVWTDFLQAAYHESISLIAPSDSQRLKYADHLHVYGKGKTAMTPRMADLLNEYVSRLNKLESQDSIFYRDKLYDLYDVFEPGYLYDALAVTVAKKKFTMGHLIFNPQFWKENGFATGKAGGDALTKMFISEDLWSEVDGAKTFLKLEVYECGLEHPALPKTEWPRPTVSAFKARKQIWSSLPLFPPNLLPIELPPATDEKKDKKKKKPKKKSSKKGAKTQAEGVEEEVGEEAEEEAVEGEVTLVPKVVRLNADKQKTMEFKHIIRNSNRVVIGPLEYCGHGKVVKTSRKRKNSTKHKYIPLAVYGDPRVGLYRSALSLWSMYAGKGKGKRALTRAQRKKLDERQARVREPGMDTDVEDSDDDYDGDENEGEGEGEGEGEDKEDDDDEGREEERGQVAKEHGEGDIGASIPSITSAGAPLLLDLPVTPVRKRISIIPPPPSPNMPPSSPCTLVNVSSPTVVAPSSPLKRKYMEEKENQPPLQFSQRKRVRKVGSGLGPRKSQDSHLVSKARLFTPSPKGGPRRSKRAR